jgi:S-adenosylhomocysteine hydrolase
MLTDKLAVECGYGNVGMSSASVRSQDASVKVTEGQQQTR